MTASLLRSRITLVWLALVIATGLSWESAGGLAWAGGYRIATTLVLVIAFLKVRLIIMEFMELRRAPLPMRLAAEAWACLVCAAVIVLYWIGASPA